MPATEARATHSDRPYGVRLRPIPTPAPSGRYSAHRGDFIDAFYKALSAWREESAFSSFIEDKIASPHFRRIVNLGEPAIPLIVRELRTDPSFLFLALEEITGENPVPDSARGRPAAMVDAWLFWADHHASVNAG